MKQADEALASPSVFVSYARKDMHFVLDLVRDLTGAGIVAHVDRHIEGGARWWDRIKEDIANAAAVLFVVSPEFNLSKNCADEIEFAASLKKLLVPICREVHPDHPILKAIQFVHVHQTLVHQLRNIIARTAEHYRDHIRLTGLAFHWEAGGRKTDPLLRGLELLHFRQWMEAEDLTDKETVSRLQREFIEASQSNHYEVSVRRASAALENGLFLDALDTLVDAYMPSWTPTDSWIAWEKTAAALLRAATIEPLDKCIFREGRVTSLATSFEDWFIGVGTRQGETYIQRFRQPDEPDAGKPKLSYWDHCAAYKLPLTVQAIPCLVHRQAAERGDVEVSFLSGARYALPLLVRGAVSGGALFYMGAYSLEAHPQEASAVLFDHRDPTAVGPVTATCASDGELTLSWRKQETRVHVPVDQEDELCGLKVLKDSGGFDVAVVSRHGRFHLIDPPSGSIREVDLGLKQPVRRLRGVTGSSRAVMIETGDEVLLIDCHASSPAIFRMRFAEKKIQYAAGFVFLRQLEYRVVVGYSDGRLQVHTFGIGTREEIRTCMAHRGPVHLIQAAEDGSAFVSASRDGSIAVWKEPFSQPAQMILAGSVVTALCYADENRGLLTADTEGRLRYWDISGELSLRHTSDPAFLTLLERCRYAFADGRLTYGPRRTPSPCSLRDLL
jgi:hypothetical protein